MGSVLKKMGLIVLLTIIVIVIAWFFIAQNTYALEGTAYAKYDNSNKTLTFFRSTEEYTNGQEEGDVTYYTGIETTQYSRQYFPGWHHFNDENVRNVETIVF